MVTLLGIIAGCLVVGCQIPQIIKIVKTKGVEDISLMMYVMFLFGVVLWLIYGMILKDIPLILTNTLSGILISIVIMLKLAYKEE